MYCQCLDNLFTHLDFFPTDTPVLKAELKCIFTLASAWWFITLFALLANLFFSFDVSSLDPKSFVYLTVTMSELILTYNNYFI